MCGRLIRLLVAACAVLGSCAGGPHDDLASKPPELPSALVMQARFAKQALMLLGTMQGQFELEEGRFGRLDELLRAYPRILSRETLADLNEYTFREWFSSDRKVWLFMALPRTDADEGDWFAIGSIIELSYYTDKVARRSMRKPEELVKVDGSSIKLNGMWSPVHRGDQK